MGSRIVVDDSNRAACRELASEGMLSPGRRRTTSCATEHRPLQAYFGVFRIDGLCWVSARKGLTLRGAVHRPSQGGLKSHLRWSTFPPTIRILFYAIEMPNVKCVDIADPVRCSTNSLRQPSDHAVIDSIRPLESDGPQGARRVKLTEPSVESPSVACQPRQPGRSDQYFLASASLDSATTRPTKAPAAAKITAVSA
jgi:hypothetical protein